MRVDIFSTQFLYVHAFDGGVSMQAMMAYDLVIASEAKQSRAAPQRWIASLRSQ
jgi:hypothetical protein